MVYLDNAATTPLNTAAISAMTHIMTETFGNPSSPVSYTHLPNQTLTKRDLPLLSVPNQY